MSVFVIAEAGKAWLTHEGITIEECLHNARILALAAKYCSADCVKFQCHVFEDEQFKRDDSRHEWIKLNEKLTPFNEFWLPLKEYCDMIGVEFLCTPMSTIAAVKINLLVKRWKVASPDINDWDLLEYLVSTEKEIIISAGMSTLEERSQAADFLDDRTDYLMLHCVSEYPTPLERMAMYQIENYSGLSDHSMSLITGAMAVTLGARVIEKHFTVDGWGRDAHMSLNPEQLKTYISNIREAEKAMTSVELPTKKEMELRKLFKV